MNVKIQSLPFLTYQQSFFKLYYKSIKLAEYHYYSKSFMKLQTSIAESNKEMELFW